MAWSHDLNKKLNVLRTKGRKLAKKAKAKPFYFSGKKKKISAKTLAALAKGREKLKKIRAEKKKVIKRKVSKINKPLILKELSGMAKRKTKKTRKTSKRKHTYGFEGVTRKRSRKRKTSHKRRYLHGVSEGRKPSIMGTVIDGVGIVGGAIGASALSKMIPIANPKIKSLIPIALGIGLSTMKFGRKGIGKNVALGSVTVGILSLVKQLVPSLPLMGEEYYGYPQTVLTGEEQAMLGLPFNGENLGDELGDEMGIEGDEIGDDYISSDDI